MRFRLKGRHWARAALLLAVASQAPMAGAGTNEPALVLVRGPEAVELTLGELDALPKKTIVTENEFADGQVAYRGPLVRDVLERLALDQTEKVRLLAANDYYVDIPTSDFMTYDVILAMEADGRELSQREMGPLWLMYPISEHAELRDPTYIQRLIWQVIRIESL
ncbi:molybdopterin-dependent oxidoreductase [uncultured Amaricoccus sp.]|uniref:molybdopterin-dependent oxidoreductase n=1 Tax=uncultured Amaricoccus sp. TaxID=339341 RepID=UPI00261DCF5B|nr:molybdopterin-dependent oxidoreductase [uncultured Amaricoccus sp.]